jgi:uncharacterized RDD family membrane protein YckC
MVWRFAGFWLRVLALSIDILVLVCFSYIAENVLGANSRGLESLSGLFDFVIPIAYYVILTVVYGQTLGKMLVGIKVIRQDRQAHTWGNILVREVIGKFTSTIILFVGYFMAGFDAQKKSLHDRIANTYVVKVMNSSGEEQVQSRELGHNEI